MMFLNIFISFFKGGVPENFDPEKGGGVFENFERKKGGSLKIFEDPPSYFLGRGGHLNYERSLRKGHNLSRRGG